MSERKNDENVILVGKDLTPTDDMHVKKFDLAHSVNMRDFLCQIVRMTVSEENYSLVLAGMSLLIVESVEGREAQARANLENTLEIYKKLEELKEQRMKEKLARIKIDGQPS